MWIKTHSITLIDTWNPSRKTLFSSRPLPSRPGQTDKNNISFANSYTPGRHTSTFTNCTMTPKAHKVTDIQLESWACGIPSSLNGAQRHHEPTSPDSRSNVDEGRWKSLYVSVSLSVSVLIAQQAAQYSNFLSVSLNLSWSFLNHEPPTSLRMTDISRIYSVWD